MPPAASPPIQRLRFRLAGGAQPLLLIPVRVNDEGPFEFILDTGAGTSLISPELAASLHIASTDSRAGQTAGGTVQVALAQLDSLTVGEAREENLQVAIVDLSMIGRTVGAKLDGDLGYNFLKHFRLTIDYRALEVKLEDPRRVGYLSRPARAEVPMRRSTGQAPHPDRRPDRRTRPISICDRYRHLHHCAFRRVGAGTRSARHAHRSGYDRQRANSDVGRAASLSARGRGATRGGRLLDWRFLEHASQACGCKLDGIVGYNFLRHYRTVIDYPNELFRLE